MVHNKQYSITLPLTINALPMKPAKTKTQISAEIGAQICSYLSHGGTVSEHIAGESGRIPNAPLPKAPHVEHSSIHSRTPVLAEIQAIEARRHKPPNKPLRRAGHTEKKTLLTDDFGEPLRWISK